jgi:hypothetical protein
MRRRLIIALAARSIGAFVSAAVMSGRFGKSPEKEPVSKSTTTSVSKSSTIITLSASTPTPSDTLTGPGTLRSYQSFWPYGKDEKGNHTVPGPWFVSCASHVTLKGNDYVKVTVDPASFPSKTTLSWKFASDGSGSVKCYPFLGYGGSSYFWYMTGTVPPPKTVSAFTELTVNFNVTKNFGDATANCMFECWLPTEVSFFVQNPANPCYDLIRHFAFSDGGWEYHIAQNGPPGAQIIITPVTAPGGNIPRDLTGQTISWPVLPVLRELLRQGWIDDGEISQMQFGCEAFNSAGSLTFNSINWNWV